MFEKIYLLQKFSEKHVSPQIVRLETLTPLLITLLTIFDQKSVFSTELKKKSLSHPAPRSEKRFQTENFSRKKFFLDEVYLDR